MQAADAFQEAGGFLRNLDDWCDRGCNCTQALEEQLRALRDSAAAVAARRERVAAQLEAGGPEPVEALAHAQSALEAAHQLQVPHSFRST